MDYVHISKSNPDHKEIDDAMCAQLTNRILNILFAIWV